MNIDIVIVGYYLIFGLSVFYGSSKFISKLFVLKSDINLSGEVKMLY